MLKRKDEESKLKIIEKKNSDPRDEYNTENKNRSNQGRWNEEQIVFR